MLHVSNKKKELLNKISLLKKLPQYNLNLHWEKKKIIDYYNVNNKKFTFKLKKINSVQEYNNNSNEKKEKMKKEEVLS